MVETDQTVPNSFLDNFWGPDDDDEINPEVQSYYLNFLSKTEKLKADIVGYDFLEKDKKQYTAYKIHVTVDFTEYDIHKRFSLFEQFRKQLIEKYPELNLDKLAFPQKSIFGFFRMDTVEKTVKRQMTLHDFLQVIVNNCKNYSIIELLDFLEVKDRLKSGEGNQANYLSMDKSYATNSQEVAKLMQYLDLLNKNPDDTSKILKEMEAFYTSSRPRISPDIARAVLIGKPKSQGLMQFCGKTGTQSSSHLVCVIGLEFLASLMDHQKCQDADYFISSFGNLDPKMIGLLNLTDHIEGNIKSTCKSHALKLVDTYLSRNPRYPPSAILKKNSAIQEYELWRRQNKTNSLVAERYQVSGKFDEVKETTDFSLSPVTPTVEQLDDFSANPEKMFPKDKAHWTELYKDENIKIKYYKSKDLSINLKSTKGMEACVREAAKGIDYRILCEESRTVKEIDVDISLQLVKVKADNPNYKHLVFMNERKIEEDMGDETMIFESPCKNYSVMLNSSELLAKRISFIKVKYDNKSKGKKRKIKLLVKNLDQGSMTLQKSLVEENGGKLVIESCKKFLEELQNY